MKLWNRALSVVLGMALSQHYLAYSVAEGIKSVINKFSMTVS